MYTHCLLSWLNLCWIIVAKTSYSYLLPYHTSTLSSLAIVKSNSDARVQVTIWIYFSQEPRSLVWNVDTETLIGHRTLTTFSFCKDSVDVRTTALYNRIYEPITFHQSATHPRGLERTPRLGSASARGYRDVRASFCSRRRRHRGRLLANMLSMLFLRGRHLGEVFFRAPKNRAPLYFRISAQTDSRSLCGWWLANRIIGL